MKFRLINFSEICVSRARDIWKFYEIAQFDCSLWLCWCLWRSLAARSLIWSSCRWSLWANAWSIVSCCFILASSKPLLEPGVSVKDILKSIFIDMYFLLNRKNSYRTRRLTAIAFSMASLSLRPLFFRKTQLWSFGCRCFRQTLFEHESHFNSINSRTLHFGAQQVPSFFFFRFRAAAFESQSRSICSETIWSSGLSLSNGTGLSHIGHVGTCLLFFGAKNIG